MEQLILDLLNQLMEGQVTLRHPNDLVQLPSTQLLRLCDRCPDALLPIVVRFLKEAQGGAKVFEKLMGEHEEENRELVDRFFHRYYTMVMEDSLQDFNPLLLYLDPAMFQDLALIQTREDFFKSQTIDHINEFLQAHFLAAPQFQIGEQDKAWAFFFQELLRI